MKRKYLIAVSGGPDSMALLHKKRKSILAVIHINYHARIDSDNDAMIVKNYCEKYNITLYVYDCDKNIINNAKENKQSLYRKIRYQYFVKIANELKVNKILIAHHFNDFIETAYMQKKLNKNVLFLGIKKTSNYQNLILIRPLLKKTKRELELYCNKHKIHYAVDYSNLTNIYFRNQVRNELKNWSNKQIKQFYLQIKKYNKKNKPIIKKIKTLYNEWNNSNYELSFFKTIESQYQKFVLNLFLNHLGLKGSENKINLLLQFINKQNNNTTKKLRLKQNLYISIRNNHLILDNKTYEK